MRARVRTLRRVARFVLVIALVLFNAVPPIAAQTAPSVIYACIGPDGPARVIGPSETCRPNEVRVQWDAAGQQGPKGPTGDAGATGPQGPQGAQGSQGSTGPAGPGGAQGVAGPQGAEGPQGPRGDQGGQGPIGGQGTTGATGAQGPTGPAGVDGPQGPVGAQGPQGEQGAQGPAGPVGEAGAQGPKGATGPAGPPAAIGKIQGGVQNCSGQMVPGALAYTVGRGFTAITGADGLFVFHNVPEGTYTVAMEVNGAIVNIAQVTVVGTDTAYLEYEANQCTQQPTCDASCATCSGPGANECTSCNLGDELYNGQCVSTCPAGTYTDGSVCSACDASCTTCSGTGPNACTSCPSGQVVQGGACVAAPVGCPSGQFMYNGQCVSTCPSGTYVNSGTCTPCSDTHCTTCAGNVCSTCNAGYYFNTPTQNLCVLSADCPIGTGSGANGRCNTCTGLNCKSCPNNVCNACNTGFFLSAGICRACPSNCATCNTTTACLACKPGYHLVGTACQIGS